MFCNAALAQLMGDIQSTDETQRQQQLHSFILADAGHRLFHPNILNESSILVPRLMR